MDKKSLYIHFIEVGADRLFTAYKAHLPRVGDEIRIGGEGNERFYKVIRVVWCYDED